MNTETTILAVIVIIALVGVCIHSLLEMGRSEDDELDFTLFDRK